MPDVLKEKKNTKRYKMYSKDLFGMRYNIIKSTSWSIKQNYIFFYKYVFLINKPLKYFYF